MEHVAIVGVSFYDLELVFRTTTLSIQQEREVLIKGTFENLVG